MTELSPQAQAVLDAAFSAYWSAEQEASNDAHVIAAAALRAAADHTVPEQAEPPCGESEPWPQSFQLMADSKWEQRQQTRAKLLSIAAELEGKNCPGCEGTPAAENSPCAVCGRLAIKPPSLKEQALAAQQRMWDGGSTHEDWQLIRRALEQLDD